MSTIPESTEKYDVAFSFAGAQREYVKKVKDALVKYSVSVFYDNDHIEELWGKNLYRYLNRIYTENAVYCVVFISKEYKERTWTIHESQSAQERMFMDYDGQNFQEYILPVRFDETDIPGIRRTTGYIDAKEVGPEELAYLIAKKLHKTSAGDSAPNKNISSAYEELLQVLYKRFTRYKQLRLHTEKNYLRIGIMHADEESAIIILRRINDCIHIYRDGEILENPAITVFIDSGNPVLPFKIVSRFSLSFDFIEKNVTFTQLSELLCIEIEHSLR